jgi:hypothetical protein
LAARASTLAAIWQFLGPQSSNGQPQGQSPAIVFCAARRASSIDIIGFEAE